MSANLYNTRTLNGTVINSITSEIRIAKISNIGIKPLEDFTGIFLITEEAFSTPPFQAPIEVDGDWYIDSRRFSTVNKAGGLRLTDTISADYFTELTLLEREWCSEDDKSDFYFKSPTNLTHYCNWIARNLAHHFRLEFAEENRLLAAAALFFTGQHFNSVKADSKASVIERYIKNSKLVLMEDSLDSVKEDQEIDYPRTTEEFCNFVRNGNISLVFNTFDVAQFHNIMSRTFAFGVVDPNVALFTAIEHPPAFMALRSVIIKNSYLRKTILGSQLYADRDTTYNTVYNRWVDKLKG